jgi:hypothetical protein
VGGSNCFGPQLGYTIPLDVVTGDTLPLGVTDMLDQPLLPILVFHPISAGLALVTSVFSLFIANRPLSMVTLSLSIWAGILSTVAFAADVVVVSVAKSRVDEGFLVVFWGAGPWLTLVATIFIWISVVLLSIRVCNCCGSRRFVTFSFPLHNIRLTSLTALVNNKYIPPVLQVSLIDLLSLWNIYSKPLTCL